MSSNKLTISQLKNKWSKEKEYYKIHEIGSGVQSFIKDILQSEEIFNLKEGRLSTKDEDRKREFIHEKHTRNHRRGDFVIFINSEIIIPIEVECYGNIENGKKQLRNYQADLGKKYGILTDGSTWRFYNNHIPIKEFDSEQEIFSDPALFLTFWNEYIIPNNYYLSFFEKKGQLFLFENKLFIEKNQEYFFEDITTLIKNFKNKLKIGDYFEELPEKEKDKKATEITYAYIIQFILYKTLVDNAFANFDMEYKENVNNIYKYIKYSNYKDILSIVDQISDKITKNIYRPFSEEQESISKKIRQLYRYGKELSDISPWLDIFVFVNKYNFQNVRNEIFGYIYENYLKELFEEKQLGQYFTDPVIVDFMLQQVGYTTKEIKKKIESNKLDKLSIIDPACGSGTFLYKAVNEIINSFSIQTSERSTQIKEIISNNVFGLDIAEFPLYLAEMSIIMRLLPFIVDEKYNKPIENKIKVFETKDSIAEFIGAGLENTVVDQYVRGGQTLIGFTEQEPDYETFMRDKDNLKEVKISVKKYDEVPRRRFDYVIANPPYIGYLKCCKQNVLIFNFIKKGKVKLNNIYGVNLHSTPNNRKKYAPTPNLYAFFIALGLALLKDNAKLCYIIPQTILTASALDVLRYHLAKYVTIEKIITFSRNLFIGRGLKQQKVVPTSSLIFVVSKNKPAEKHKVEIVNYTDDKDTIKDTLSNILANKKIDKRKVLQSKLLKNIVNWNFIKQDKMFLDFYEQYQKSTDDIVIYYNHKLAQDRFGGRFYFDRGLKFKKDKIYDLKGKITQEIYHLAELHRKRYVATVTPRVVKTTDIKVPHGGQGLSVYDKKYKIIWNYMNYHHFYYSDRKIMIDFNYIIISSDNKSEIVYLHSLLESKIIDLILNKLVKAEKEKDILVGIKTIKEYVRVPRITEDNQFIKNEIIKRKEELFALEENTLSDFVDFSNIMVQKFDRVLVKDCHLILKRNNEVIKLDIRENLNLIKKVIYEKYNKKILISDKQSISLSELKDLPVIDYEKQNQMKEYIDDLIFALYFNIPIERLGLNKAIEIKSRLLNNKYYNLIKNVN